MTDTPDHYSEEEARARAEATLKVMLATPHKPHKAGKLGRTRKPAPSRSRKKPD
jgi:hypothetical protein